jgi:hypothetical protein
VWLTNRLQKTEPEAGTRFLSDFTVTHAWSAENLPKNDYVSVKYANFLVPGRAV